MNNVLALSEIVIKELLRRKDFYVLFVLTALATSILASINLFNDTAIVGFIKEASLLLIWISSLVIAITTTARQIPSERENRTIFPLLAKPISRSELIMGKFLGCWLACGICLVVFYLFFIIVSGWREHAWPISGYIQAIWLHWMMLAIVVAVSLLGSIIFAAPSSNSTITFVVVAGILFLAQHLGKIALQLSPPSNTIVYGIYFAVPHLEFFDVRDLLVHYADRVPLVPWKICALSSLYGAAYTVAFLVATCVLFRRKNLG